MTANKDTDPVERLARSALICVLVFQYLALLIVGVGLSLPWPGVVGAGGLMTFGAWLWMRSLRKQAAEIRAKKAREEAERQAGNSAAGRSPTP